MTLLTKIPRTQWQQFFDCASKILGARPTKVEVTGLSLGDHIAADWVNANNGRLTRILDDLGDQSHRLGLITLKHAGRLKEAIAEHREIFLAIEARDPNRAEVAMRKHFRADCDAAVRDAMPAGHTQSRLRARR